jgi:hypothetical protein
MQMAPSSRSSSRHHHHRRDGAVARESRRGWEGWHEVGLRGQEAGTAPGEGGGRGSSVPPCFPRWLGGRPTREGGGGSVLWVVTDKTGQGADARGTE